MSELTEIDTPSENWNAYRLLVVKSLEQLDERTRDIHAGQQKIFSRVGDAEKCIEDIQEDLTKLQTKLSELDTNSSIQKGKDKVLGVIGKGAWGVGMVVITILINLLFHLIGTPT